MLRLLGCLCAVFGFLVLLGSVTAEDIGPIKSKGDFEAFFRKLDTDRNGRLSKTEFLQMANQAKDKTKAREKLAKVFDMLDPENKGITKERLKSYLDSSAKSSKKS